MTIDQLHSIINDKLIPRDIINVYYVTQKELESKKYGDLFAFGKQPPDVKQIRMQSWGKGNDGSYLFRITIIRDGKNRVR